MDEKEKNQKTLVAIIAGLVIGGLLVWVFSSASNDQAATDEQDGDVTSQEENTSDTNNGSDDDTSGSSDTRASGSTNAPVVVNGGSVDVEDQQAGGAVALSGIEYPDTTGWVVVREELDGGELGNILGAARFDTEVGLTPEEVRLLRETEAGKTYHVIVYSENGDNVFDLQDDLPVETADGELIEAVFVAEGSSTAE